MEGEVIDASRGGSWYVYLCKSPVRHFAETAPNVLVRVLVELEYLNGRRDYVTCLSERCLHCTDHTHVAHESSVLGSYYPLMSHACLYRVTNGLDVLGGSCQRFSPLARKDDRKTDIIDGALQSCDWPDWHARSYTSLHLHSPSIRGRP